MAWLSMGLVLLTLSTAFVSVCPNLHQLIHEHTDSQSHENDSDDGSSDSGSHSGSCLACSIQSGSIESSEPFSKADWFSGSIILFSALNRSQSAGTAEYHFPLSQAPPHQA
jgi:hypothetical protein